MTYHLVNVRRTILIEICVCIFIRTFKIISYCSYCHTKSDQKKWSEV